MPTKHGMLSIQYLQTLWQSVLHLQKRESSLQASAMYRASPAGVETGVRSGRRVHIRCLIAATEHLKSQRKLRAMVSIQHTPKLDLISRICSLCYSSLLQIPKLQAEDAKLRNEIRALDRQRMDLCDEVQQLSAYLYKAELENSLLRKSIRLLKLVLQVLSIFYHHCFCFALQYFVILLMLKTQLAAEHMSSSLLIKPPAGTASCGKHGVSCKMSSSSLSCDKEHSRTGWAACCTEQNTSFIARRYQRSFEPFVAIMT